MSDVNNKSEATTLETEIGKVLGNDPTRAVFGRRPPVSVTAPAIPDEHRTRQAMAAVDRQTTTEALSIEAFVDEAIHARIVMVRGKYDPGPARSLRAQDGARRGQLDLADQRARPRPLKPPPPGNGGRPMPKKGGNPSTPMRRATDDDD